MKRVVVAPTVTAYDTHEYRQQMELLAPFSKQVHIDLMDGSFAPTRSPDIDRIWWPPTMRASVHLMYQNPSASLNNLIKLNPRMVVIHAESKVDHMHFASQLHAEGIKSGLALLAQTPVSKIKNEVHSFDHILIFSGKLGYHGGSFDESLIAKVKEIKNIAPEVEIGWDGGINADNANKLVEAGVTVLNVGGYIHKAVNPEAAYGKLKQLIER